MKVFFEACLSNFLTKNIGAKAAHKMLVKFTKGVNLINILQATFGSCSFGSAHIKADRKMMVILTKRSSISSTFLRTNFLYQRHFGSFF